MRKNISGQWGEDLAAEYLSKHGYEVIERNYHSRFGEIDIIAKKENLICFIEVKTRKNIYFGHPLEAVNYYKQIKLIKTAKLYIVSHYSEKYSYRFDIIDIIYNGKLFFKINYLEGAFEL